MSYYHSSVSVLSSLTTNGLVLYRAQTCQGSDQALQRCQGFLEDILVVDEATLAAPLPGWLTGTPTLVYSETKMAFRGTETIAELEDFAEQGYEAPKPPELPDEQAFDRMRNDKVTEDDITRQIKGRESQLPRQPEVQQ